MKLNSSFIKWFHNSCIVLTLASMGFSTSAWAGGGTLDRSFDNDGLVTTALVTYPYRTVTSDVLYQSDGKIIAVGYSNSGSVPDHHGDFILVRYNADGSLDASFGSGGIVFTDFGNSGDFAKSAALQSDGKIVVLGERYFATTYYYGSSDFALARYNNNGSLDTSFGTGGIVTTNLNPDNGFDTADALTIQADGKIVAVGMYYSTRYNPDGSMDVTFGSNGLVRTDSINMQVTSVALQGDGKLVLGGLNTGTTPVFALLRLNTDASMDTSFNGTGMSSTNVLGSGSYEPIVAVQTDGKLVLGGTSASQFALLRFIASGVLDTSFGTDGVTISNFDNFSQAYDLVIQTDGRILLGGQIALPTKFKTLGSTIPATQLDFALARYNSNGTLDTTFGNKGLVTTGINTNSSGPYVTDWGRALALQADGKILFAGNTSIVNGFALARYLSQ